MNEGYPWKKEGDSYSIFGIPIFQETVDRRGKEETSYDLGKLRKLVDENRQAEDVHGHFPSVHWGHNVDGVEREKLGEAHNFRIGKLLGKYTVFVDIKGIEEKDFSLLERGKFPHVSVEITRTNPRRIGSIAFLSSNSPYFVLPNIKPGKELKKFRNGLLTIYKSGDTIEFLNQFDFQKFEFKGGDHMPMPEDLKKDEEPKKMMDEPQKDEPDKMQDESPMDSIISRLDAIEARLDAIEGGGSDEVPSTAEAVSSPSEGGQMKAGNFDAFMAMKKEMGTVKKEMNLLKAHSQEVEIDRQVEQALRFFFAEGIQVDESSFKTKFKEKVKKYGLKAGMEYITEIEEIAPRMTTQKFSASPYFAPAASKKSSKSDLLFIEKYKEEGDEEYKKAVEAEAFFSENRHYFESQNLALKDFVEGEVGAVRLKKSGII